MVEEKEAPVRKARMFVWAHPNDCDPPHGLDMESDRDYLKVQLLRNAFLAYGFDLDEPVMIGYPLNGRIQLLSGTHRHMAAVQADILIPVSLWLRSDVERMWGTEDWLKAIEDIPVRKLMEALVSEGAKVPAHEPVDTSRLYAL